MVKMGEGSIVNIKCELGEHHLTYHFFTKQLLVECTASAWYGHGVMQSGNQHIVFTAESSGVFCDETEGWWEHISLGTEVPEALKEGLGWMRVVEV